MKKTTVITVLVLSLMMIFASVASAEEPGFFGRMAQDEYADQRLSILDQVAEKVAVSIPNQSGVSFEVGQAFYAGDLLFISYRMGANTDLITLYEGAPDAGIEFNQMISDWVEGEISAFTPDVKKEHDWLDGKSQHWLESPYCHIQEGIDLDDGTHVSFIGGTELRQDDGSILGWRECVIPADKAAGTLNFSVAVDSAVAIKFQDFTTFKAYFGEPVKSTVAITLNQVDDPMALKVLAPPEATAEPEPIG